MSARRTEVDICRAAGRSETKEGSGLPDVDTPVDYYDRFLKVSRTRCFFICLLFHLLPRAVRRGRFFSLSSTAGRKYARERLNTKEHQNSMAIL